jgi:hypothetical protein
VPRRERRALGPSQGRAASGVGSTAQGGAWLARARRGREQGRGGCLLRLGARVRESRERRERERELREAAAAVKSSGIRAALG